MRKQYRIGELASQTGLSVRALRHYESLGLLGEVSRTASAQRVYGSEAIGRLARLQSLKALGFGLSEIGALLNDPGYSPLRLVELHLTRADARLQQARQLRERLEGLATSLRERGPVSTDTFLKLIDVMTMVEKYFSPEQLAVFEKQRQAIGEERIRDVQAEWPKLMAEVKAHLDRGTDPASAEMQLLAKRWMALVHESTGGDPAINARLVEMYRQEPQVRQQFGVDMEVMAYVQRAVTAGRNTA